MAMWQGMTGRTGFPISSRKTSGLDQNTVRRGQNMLSIATRRLIATTILGFASAVAAAKDVPPRILQEPVLGLRLEAANVKLDSLPEDVRALCLQTADNERRKGRLWVFARAADAATTYYVVAGYFKRLYPEP